ncbi:MAG: 6-pyruvoyltetrahydropterin/6-carboxytetrahydropterin synthase [Thermodesulfobacteriota bacterium]|nr:6-pyruvoyltetrahydropterin/6-carboxytetrahydropterin synthase [Thermodesulfobacteriota bacterium]
MNPFELFQSSGIYKVAILYFSASRGLAIIGRYALGNNVEVIQISGEVDPHTGNFTALDYVGGDSPDRFPVVSQSDFEALVSFIESKIDSQTQMSVIEPEVIRTILSRITIDPARKYLH